MSAPPLDSDFIYVTVTAPDQAEAESSHSPESSSTQARRWPCGHEKLSRSLSKSDSDLLVPCGEDVAVAERTKSLAKCRTEKTQMDQLSSLTADWEEVSALGIRGNKTKQNS